MGMISPYHGKVVWAICWVWPKGIIRKHFSYNIDEGNMLSCLWTRKEEMFRSDKIQLLK